MIKTLTPKYKKIICIVIVAIVILGLGIWFLSRQNVSMAENQTWGRSDAKEIDINSKVAGRVIKLLVKEGDTVKKDQVIANIDNRDLIAQKEQLEANIKALEAQELQASVQTSLTSGTSMATVGTSEAQLQSAKANLALAKSDFNRFSELVSSGAVSQQTFDTYKTKYQVAQAAYAQAQAGLNKADSGMLETNVSQANQQVAAERIEQAKAGLQQLEVQLDESVIRAPFDGIITEKYIEEGSMISLGTPLVAIQDPSDNWVDFKIPETELSKFYLQQKLMMMSRDNKTKIEGTVTDISKKAEFATERATSERGDSTDIISFNVKVQVNSDKLWPGMRFRLIDFSK
ncbi:HlyD family secretion protein [Pectinatus frisingensis]|uniref:HlyD family secretion protein n=1 Tax=Pectinatus frisingensis TaxID=865 RepID=UPI0015F5DF2A|nr:HlyD family efflux transporter periplasmic adaptor subunit [Pectinatus frisingensis]